MKLLEDTTAGASADPQAAQLLHRLGFSGYEARVWLELANGYPVTAYQLAKRAGLQRANTYRALERLLELDAVSIVHKDPVTYAPADPRAMVSRLTAGLNSECDWFAGHLSRRMQSRNRGLIQTGSGTADCLEQLRRELATATRYVWLKGEAATLRLLVREIAAAQLRGVAVAIIAFGAWQALQKKLPGVRVFPHEGSGTRLSPATDALLTLARDGRTVATAVFSDEPTVTVLQDHALTYQLHSYLLHEIFLAELVMGEGGERIDQELARLRKHYRPARMESPLLHERYER